MPAKNVPAKNVRVKNMSVKTSPAKSSSAEDSSAKDNSAKNNRVKPLAKVCCGTSRDIPLSERDADRLAEVFAALADPVRLRLLSLISSSPDGEVCACDLVGPIGKSQPTVSHHLRILFEAGLVEREKRGVWVWYRAEPSRLDEVAAQLR
jgi:ArsR family transcriptional regulator